MSPYPLVVVYPGGSVGEELIRQRQRRVIRWSRGAVAVFARTPLGIQLWLVGPHEDRPICRFPVVIAVQKGVGGCSIVLESTEVCKSVPKGAEQYTLVQQGAGGCMSVPDYVGPRITNHLHGSDTGRVMRVYAHHASEIKRL
jgi:hypothetical protein